MAGEPPIDRVRQTRRSATPYEEHRQRLTQKQANLEQTDTLEEGERDPAIDAGPEPQPGPAVQADPDGQSGQEAPAAGEEQSGGERQAGREPDR